MSHVVEGDLHAYLDGAVLPDTPEYEGIQAHLAFCSDCRVRLEEAAELRALAQEALGELRTADIAVPPFHEVSRMANPDPVSGSPARRPLPIALAAAAMVVLAFGLGWMGRDVANLRGPRSGTTTSEAGDDRSPDTFAELRPADPDGSGRARGAADVGGEAAGPAQPDASGEPREPGSSPAAPSASGGRTGGDDASEPASAPGPRVALARPSVGRVPSPTAPLRSLEPLAREASPGGETGARAAGEDAAMPGSYGREAVGERRVTPDPARPRPSPVFPWSSVGDRPGAAPAPLALRDNIPGPARGLGREPSTLSRERAELRLGAPVVVVSDLSLPVAWDRVEEAPRRVRTTQTLPDGTVLALTQWRTGETQSPEAEQRPVDAIDASLPLEPRVVRQGRGDDGRNFIHVELWSGQAVLEIAAPLTLDALLPLAARLEALR